MKVALPGKLTNSQKICVAYTLKRRILLCCDATHHMIHPRLIGMLVLLVLSFVMIDVLCKYSIETAEFWLRVGKLARRKEHGSQWL